MSRLAAWLWKGYSYAYDGLLGFWPYQNLMRQTLNELQLKDHEYLLDAGCGTGNFLGLAVKQGATAVGVDGSAAMLAGARRKLTGCPVTLVTADLLEFLQEQPDSSFDKVVSINVLYAVNFPSQVVSELVRVTRPGGRLVISTATKTGSVGIINEHLKHAPFWQLLRPKLIAVFIFDALIDVFGLTRHFPFPSEASLIQWLENAGCTVEGSTRVYGDVAVVIAASK
jgi:ubiquinone/menaquinone biosynthesis C-methylase UbiE